MHGTHWEWRGFGRVTQEFEARFDALDDGFGRQDVVDDYLYIDRLEVNAKLREGVAGEDGLKLKRLHATEGEFEQWEENPDEVFRFPVDAEGWASLARVFADVGVALPTYPGEPLARERCEELIRAAGADVVRVQVLKSRRARIWRGAEGAVKVERADISAPETVVSIGLETWNDRSSGESELSDQDAVAALRAARSELGIDIEPLAAMNYLDAVRVWARGGHVASDPAD